MVPFVASIIICFAALRPAPPDILMLWNLKEFGYLWITNNKVVRKRYVFPAGCGREEEQECDAKATKHKNRKQETGNNGKHCKSEFANPVWYWTLNLQQPYLYRTTVQLCERFS